MILLIDYEKKFANKLRLEMTARIKAIVAQENIPIKQVYASVRKEALVSEILSTRGDVPGIVCILSAMESWRPAIAGTCIFFCREPFFLL